MGFEASGKHPSVGEPHLVLVFSRLLQAIVDGVELSVLRVACPLPHNITDMTGSAIKDGKQLASWMKNDADAQLLKGVVSRMTLRRKPDHIRLEFAGGPSSQFFVSFLL